MAEEETAQLTQQIELNEQELQPEANDNLPNYSNVDEKESPDTKQHFMIIHVGYGQGFTPIFEYADGSKRDYSDPYCEVYFVSGGKQTMKTHVQFECQSDWCPQWTEYCKFFLKPDELPQVITVQAFDKKDKASGSDGMYGEYHINCAEEKIFDEAGNCFDRIVDLNSS